MWQAGQAARLQRIAHGILFSLGRAGTSEHHAACELASASNSFSSAGAFAENISGTHRKVPSF